MTSSEGFQHYFNIISNLFCCVAYTLSLLLLLKWVLISSTAIWFTGWDTGSFASRARTKLTSECEWTRIWTTYVSIMKRPHFISQITNIIYIGSWIYLVRILQTEALRSMVCLIRSTIKLPYLACLLKPIKSWFSKYFRVRNKRRGTLIVFWKKRWKMTAMPCLM